jgi:preprotein translocase subunit SecE
MAAESATKDPKEKAPRVSPAQFVREVRSETSKVTWPTFGEWRVTSIMVFIMVVVATIFFFAVDSLIALIVQLVLAG